MKSTNYEVCHYAVLSTFRVHPLSYVQIFFLALCFETLSIRILWLE